MNLSIYLFDNRRTASKPKTKGFTIEKGERFAINDFVELGIGVYTRKVNRENVITRRAALITYADNIVVIANNRSIIKSKLKELADKGKGMGLEINQN